MTFEVPKVSLSEMLYINGSKKAAGPQGTPVSFGGQKTGSSFFNRFEEDMADFRKQISNKIFDMKPGAQHIGMNSSSTPPAGCGEHFYLKA